jgi:hypothetical protein
LTRQFMMISLRSSHELTGGNAGMRWLQDNTRGWLWLIVATILAATASSAGAQAPGSEDEVKALRCSQDRIALIWMSREQLRERCGLWSKSYTVNTPEGEVERLVYSRYFVVTVRRGQVSSVRQRRQIFTGFRKER